MKKLIALLICSLVAPSAWADSFNQSIIAIYGGGNPDTGWTTDTGSGLTLGLRGKNRTTGATTNNGAGTYTFAAGTSGGLALWNYDFSINSGTSFLNQSFDYYLGVDLNPSQGISYATINALTFFADNSYGNSGTANGAGVEGTAAALAGSNFIAQNSQNIIFAGLNPNLNATYDYELFAVASGAGEGGARAAQVNMTVVVGSGGASVPDSGSTSLLITLALAGMLGCKLRLRSVYA